MPVGPSAVSPVRQRTEGPLERGAHVGRYVILKLVGRGGMGVVYAAYDPELDRKIALKLLRPDGHDVDANAGRARLLREARAMAKVNHPNACAVFDVGTWGDQVFVAMEFIEGPTLEQWLSEPRSWSEVLEVFLQAGQGLAAAHEVGLVHRDFKPANVLIGKGAGPSSPTSAWPGTCRPRVRSRATSRSPPRARGAPRRRSRPQSLPSPRRGW